MKPVALHYFVDLRIQTYTEPVPSKYGKLATKHAWIYGYLTVHGTMPARSRARCNSAVSNYVAVSRRRRIRFETVNHLTREC